MSGLIKFRTSMGGFNRVDVTNYMEKLCADHTAEVKQLQRENADLADQLSKAEAELGEKDNRVAELEKKIGSLETELEEALVLATEDSHEDTPDYPSMELEAYRRAEATERLATERACALQQRLQDLLEQASGRYGETGQEIQALTEDIQSNLQRLKDALSDLDIIFRETSGNFENLESEPAMTE